MNPPLQSLDLARLSINPLGCFDQPLISSLIILHGDVAHAHLAPVFLSREFRHAHRTFGLSLVALLVGGATLVWSSYGSAAPISWWVSWVFGAALMASLFLTFATYVLLALHLTAWVGKALLILALGWAAVVSFWMGQVLAQDFGTIIQDFQTRTLADGSLNASVAGFGSYFALTYALFIIAYLDAYRRVPKVSPKAASPSVAPPAA